MAARDPSEPAIPRHDPRPARLRVLALLSALAAGYLAASALAGTFHSIALFAAAALLILLALPAIVTLRRVALTLAVVAAGAGWWTLRTHEPRADHLGRLVSADDDVPALVRITGVVVEPARPPSTTPGPLDRFLFAERHESLRLRVESLETNDGAQPATGRVRVSAPDFDDRIRVGSRLRVTGRYLPVRGPRNPGEPDRRDALAQRGSAGTIATEPELIEILGASAAWQDRLAASAQALRARSLAAITPDDRSASSPGRALLAALLLGERTGAIDEQRAAFAEAGVAHLLAISGFHLAVLAWVTIGLLRLAGDRPRLNAIAGIAVIGAYVTLLPANTPIVRAGAMLLALLAADATGRRYDRLVILGWIAIAIALWRPSELFALGYQLSVLITAALLLVADGHRLLNPRRDPAALDRGERTPLARALSLSALRYTGVCAMCWLLGAPVVLAHSGQLGIGGPVAAALATPVASASLALGFPAAIVGMLDPELGSRIAEPAAWLASLTARIAESVAVPASIAPLPSVLAALGLAAACSLVFVRPTELGRSVTLGLLGLAVAGGAAFWSASHRLPDGVEARVTALDVGDGSALLVQRGGDAVLWDCGSLRPGVGRWVVPRAARSLGAARVRAAVITHSNIDHYAGLPRAADELGIDTVYLSRPMLDAVRAGPSASERALLSELEGRGVRLESVVAGDTIEAGAVRLEVLWPPADAPTRGLAKNDLSIVARMDVGTAGGVRTALLTGDIQRAAMAALMDGGGPPVAHVLELPHHGSHHAAAEVFVGAADPAVVLQSTGRSRLDDPRWSRVRGAIESGGAWLVTARDGAVAAEIRADGSVVTRRWAR
ncbi:MAG: ComEC/Rec2 family competence protein [Planctomycetota bacterium]